MRPEIENAQSFLEKHFVLQDFGKIGDIEYLLTKYEIKEIEKAKLSLIVSDQHFIIESTPNAID